MEQTKELHSMKDILSKNSPEKKFETYDEWYARHYRVPSISEFIDGFEYQMRACDGTDKWPMQTFVYNPFKGIDTSKFGEATLKGIEEAELDRIKKLLNGEFPGHPEWKKTNHSLIQIKIKPKLGGEKPMKSNQQLIELRDYLIEKLKDDSVKAFNPMGEIRKGDIVLKTTIGNKSIEFEKHTHSYPNSNYDYRSYSLLVNGRILGADIYGKAMDELEKELGIPNYRALMYLNETAHFSNGAREETEKEKAQRLSLEEHYLEKATGWECFFEKMITQEDSSTVSVTTPVHQKPLTRKQYIEKAYQKYLTKTVNRKGKPIKHKSFDDWYKAYDESDSRFAGRQHVSLKNTRKLKKKEAFRERKFKKLSKQIEKAQRKRDSDAYWANVRVWKQSKKGPNKSISTPQSPERLVYIYNRKEDNLIRLSHKDAVIKIKAEPGFAFISKTEGKEIIRRKQHVRIGRAIQPGTIAGVSKYGNRKKRRDGMQRKSSTVKGGLVQTIFMPKEKTKEVRKVVVEKWSKGSYEKNLPAQLVSTYEIEIPVYKKEQFKQFKTHIVPNFAHTTRKKKKPVEVKVNKFETFSLREEKDERFKKGKVVLYARVYAYPFDPDRRARKKKARQQQLKNLNDLFSKQKETSV